MKLNILGTKYTVVFEEGRPTNGYDGWVDFSSKTITIANFMARGGFEYDGIDARGYTLKTLRHEIVHAFLYESGLSSEDWAGNEDLVDWLAIQFPKMVATIADSESLVVGRELSVTAKTPSPWAVE